MEPTSGGVVTTIFNLALNILGAGGILAILHFLVRVARNLGRFETIVSEGLKANQEDHAIFNRRLEVHGKRVETLGTAVARLEGASRQRHSADE